MDLVSDDVHDGGAGFLAGLGDTRLDGIDLVGVVPEAERSQPLLGLRGITSLRGRAAGEDPARLLAIDAGLAELASALGVPDQPGAGACGGVGLAILALGGRLATGPEVTLAGVSAPVDLLVTGCTSYDFATRGGGVVASAARLAAELLCPCVVLAGEVLIGGREMRTMGVEAAYGLDVAAGDVTVATPCGRSLCGWAGAGGGEPAIRRELARSGAFTWSPFRLAVDWLADVTQPSSGDDMTTTDHATATEPVTDGIVLTGGAADKVQSLLEGEGRDDLALRVAVQPGGCSGLRYQLFFDERQLDGDVVQQFGSVNVVTDRMSAPYLMGATIDFVDTIERQGFTIDNPNATGSCACGDSFH